MKITVLTASIVLALGLAACSTSHEQDASRAANTPPAALTDQPLSKTETEAGSLTMLPPSSPKPQTVPVQKPKVAAAGATAERIEVTGARIKRVESAAEKRRIESAQTMMENMPSPVESYNASADQSAYLAPTNERYTHAKDNAVITVSAQPVSTFGLDVDTGSYSNLRRFLRQGQLPPADAVRVEELINYFSYADSKAESGHPFSVQTEIAPAPWNSAHQLLRVRIKALDKNVAALPPANLVFLVDVSGSMMDNDKLPLVKSALTMLVQQLRPVDTISLVVYAGRTNVELAPTHGDDKATILSAIARLEAGGSTAGGAAIELAYGQAHKAFRRDGINRIILATDGDFNVGISDTEQLKVMVAKQRDSGITLTTLGFGQGNYNDAMMEQIADVGNGNYAYIDSADEARKVLVDEMSATLNTVAKDAKIQIEFNPATVAEYRLIGYENRLLNEADFNNDKIDAGDVGAGKSVTALYELTPVGAAPLIDGHRYQADVKPAAKTQKANLDELAFLRIRYKPNGVENSVLLERPLHVKDALASLAQSSDDFRFAAAVAGLGQLLRSGTYTGQWSYQQAAALASSGAGKDALGYRAELVRLTQIAGSLAGHNGPNATINDVSLRD